MALESCSIGRIEESECHNLVYTHGNERILSILELSKDDFEILFCWRKGPRKNSFKTIFLRHQRNTSTSLL